ncbi:MAG: YggS family pyridoxal phosphate-dependent enzyme [Acidimicrobiales bacterium]
MTDAELVVRIQSAVVAIRSRIADVGGDPDRVRLVAVTKGHSGAVVAAAAAAGLCDVGESYVQELVAKVFALESRTALEGGGDPPPLRWHMIGQLQRNKVRQAAPHVSLWQSVDRLSLAAEIAQRAPGAAVLVQVDVAGRPGRGGCAPERVASLVEGCGDLGLRVGGLMTVGPQGPPEAVRAGFRVVRDLADQLGLEERSMGMSADLEAAVAEGSTMIRVGTALFGPRNGLPGVGK